MCLQGMNLLDSYAELYVFFYIKKNIRIHTAYNLEKFFRKILMPTQVSQTLSHIPFSSFQFPLVSCRSFNYLPTNWKSQFSIPMRVWKKVLAYSLKTFSHFGKVIYLIIVQFLKRITFFRSNQFFSIPTALPLCQDIS